MKKIVLILILCINALKAYPDCAWLNAGPTPTTGGCNNGTYTVYMPSPIGILGYVDFYLYKFPNINPGQHIQFAQVSGVAGTTHIFNALSPGDYFLVGNQYAGVLGNICSEAIVFNVGASSCSFGANIYTNPAAVPNTFGCASGSIIVYPSNSDSYTVTLTNLYNSQSSVQSGSNSFFFPAMACNYSATIVNNSQCGCSPLVLTATVSAPQCNTDIKAYALNPISGCTSGSIHMEILNPGAAIFYNVEIVKASDGSIVQSHYNSGNLIHQFNNLPADDYIIKAYEVRSAASGCYCCTEKAVIVAAASPVFFNALITTQFPIVQGCNNGQIHASINNNVNDGFFLNYWNSSWQSVYSAYLYDANWNYLANTTGSTNLDFNGLAPGIYNMIVSGVRFDAQSCPNVQVIQNIVINAPPCITLTTGATGLTNKYCDDGTITACIDLYSNECSPHIYLLDNLNNIIDEWDPNFDGACPVIFSGLPAGAYHINAFSGSCFATANISVNDGPCDFSALDFDIAQIDGLHSCNNNQLVLSYNGTACGSYEFACTNTDAPFNSESFVYNSNTNQFETLADLPPGNYTVNGANGTCTDNTTFIVSDPACSISVTATGTSIVTCSGTVSGTISNYCPPVQVELRRASGNQLVSTAISNDGNYSFTLLKNFNYKVTATDNGGCTASALASVTNVFCPEPTGLSFARVGTQKKVNVFWNVISCSIGYNLQYRLQGQSTWTNYNLSGANINSKILTGIFLGLTYEYRVRTKCTSALFSTYTPIQTFCIGNGCTVRMATDVNESRDNYEIVIYPNPAKDLIKISLDADFDNPVDIKVYDQLGRDVIAKNKITITDDFQLNVSSLTNGLYNISIITEDEKYSSRFIVTR